MTGPSGNDGGAWRTRTVAGAAAVALVLAGCGGGGGGGSGGSSSSGSSPSSASPSSQASGDTGTAGASNDDPLAAVSKSTAPYAPPDAAYYAAARFLEQASFGPTPDDVAALRAVGIDRWITQQLALPATQLQAADLQHRRFDDAVDYSTAQSRFYRAAITAPDQLRMRTSWALVQLLVVSMARVSPYAMVQYYNMLQQRAFGTYRDLLKAVSVHGSMGFYQDIVLNRKAGVWPGATPNENYARELMQLFTIGLVELDADGTPKLDGNGRPIPTYGEREVQETARALTGWEYDVAPGRPNDTDFGNFASPLRANPVLHDTDAKRIVGGRVIAAGGTAEADLDAVLDALTSHPNHAAFVSYRLIQHLVTGDPSKAYVKRVADVFRQSGGDLSQVIRAILTDREARAGDDPAVASASKGKIREPVVGRVQVLRAFGCSALPEDGAGGNPWLPGQNVFFAPTVFNFFPPTYRIPGTTSTAPEYKVLNGNLLQWRASDVSGRVWWSDRGAAWKAAGCSSVEWDQAMVRGEDAAIALISKRLLRDAMPAYLKDAISVGVFRRFVGSPDLRIYDAIGYVQLSPAFGVMR